MTQRVKPGKIRMSELQKVYLKAIFKEAVDQGRIYATSIFEDDNGWEATNRGYEAIVAFINKQKPLEKAPLLREKLINKAFERLMVLGPIA